MAGEKTPLVDKEGQHVARTVGLWSLVALTYFAVAGGPEGTETMVQTAGPLNAVLGICLVGVIWSIPTALMTAELSTAFPENGGFTLWVRAAFGDFAGEMAGWLQFVSSAVDAALYPGLFVAYLSQALDLHLSVEGGWAIQIIFVAAITVLNLCGIQQVGHGSLLFMCLLLTPFVAIILVAFSGVFTGTTVFGWAFESKNMLEEPAQPDWSGFLAVLLWNMGYWEGASVCAGEVSNIREVFPKALSIVFFIVVLNYSLPILAFAGLDNNWGAYNNGYYIDIARNVGGPGWALALGCAQCFSVAGLFANGVVKNAYQICGMGEQGMLPKPIAWRLGATQAPWLALSITLLITCVMMPLGSFKSILGIDMALYCIALILEIAALVRLRYSQPDLERAYRIPVEGVWLWLLFIPAALISLWMVFQGEWVVQVFSVGLVVAGALIIVLLNFLRSSYPDWFTGVEGVQHFDALGESESAPTAAP
mmetsp:Transcript_71878/g.150177  ORF Transcript_71878/g.150177 Transcript_71878/m.150177 type:complete len:479 (+) Transcript_71878:165-1601(+)